MMEQHLIVVIDDSWPDDGLISDVGLINYDSIKRFTEGELDWKELSLKRFVKTLIKRSSTIENVEIIGFHRIEHYIKSVDKKEIRVPNILIIDWDFGIGDFHKASDYLPLVLERKEGLDNIYIFSRSDNMQEITECLIRPEMLVPGVSIYLYDKGKKEYDQGATMEKLIDRALRKVEDVSGSTFVYNNLKIKFNASTYLNHYLDFWKIASVVGDEQLTSALKANNLVVDKEFIESVFSESSHKFYVDSTKKYLLAGTSPKFVDQFGTLETLSALEALQRFGLNKVEKALEKSIIFL